MQQVCNRGSKGVKELQDKVSGECMTDEEAGSDSEGDNKRKIRYLKLHQQSVDLEELIEHIDSLQNIKGTYKNIDGRHPSKWDTS